MVLLGSEFDHEAAAVTNRFVILSLVVVAGGDLRHIEHGIDLFGVLHLFVLVVVIVVIRILAEVSSCTDSRDFGFAGGIAGF